MIIENQTFIAASGHDKAAFAIEQHQLPLRIKNCVIDGGFADWGMKGSKAFDVIVEDCIIKNGVERALDMVRGGNITFVRCKFVNDNGARKRIKSPLALGKECDIGLKAGIADVRFEDCELNDLLLGDYSIYDQIDRPKTRRISLINCTNPNGGPIIVRGRYADKKTITFTNTGVKTCFWLQFITKTYWLYNRKFGDKRPLIGEQAVIEEREKL